MLDISVEQGIVVAVAIGWIAWVSLTLIKLMGKNSENKQNVNNLFDKFEVVSDELRNDFSSMKAEVTKDIEGVNRRFDLFLKNEIDVLKEIATTKTNHR